MSSRRTAEVQVPDDVKLKAASGVMRRAADVDEACRFLNMLGITQVNGREVLNVPETNALPRRDDGRIAPHAHQAVKTDDAAR